MALSLPALHLAIVGSIFVLLAIHRNYARWEVGTNGRYYLMHTFFSLQWFEDLKVFVPERHLRPKVNGLDSLSFRRAERLAAVGRRSDETPYQLRRQHARYFAAAIYALACLVVFGVYWMKSEVRYDLGFITLSIGYSMLPWFFVPQCVAYATLPSGVNNGPLKFPQPVRQTNLLIEVRKPGWTPVGCVATGGCLGLFGGVFAMGLFLPLLPVLGLVEMVKALHPVAMYLPWAVFYLQVFLDRPRRLKWLELDPHVLGVIEHVLFREYQFSKPNSERAVALGILPLSGAIGNTAFVPTIYFSNGQSLPLVAVGVAREVAAQRAKDLVINNFPIWACTKSCPMLI